MADTAATPSTEPRTGSCLCGKVQYEMSGLPSGMVLCHCRNCRQASGSSFAANTWYQKSQFQITQGADEVKLYHDDRTESGSSLERYFCGNCGSPLYILTPKLETGIVVPSGTQKDDVQLFSPQREFYYGHRQEWLPKFEGTADLEEM
ncbi:hypothetical protein MMC20_003039 [Loxospora ochrophaea]|nr:hypothetical protein [Loxospora ochrophaea]